MVLSRSVAHVSRVGVRTLHCSLLTAFGAYPGMYPGMKLTAGPMADRVREAGQDWRGRPDHG